MKGLTMPEAKDMLLFGAIAQRDFEGFKAEDRNRLIEGFNIVAKELGELTDKLLDDDERTLDWVTQLDIEKLNSVFRIMTSSRELFLYNTIMLQSDRLALESIRLALESIRQGLKKETKD
jgi:hypothetical protein